MEIGVRNAAAVLLLLILALGEGAQEHYRWLRRSECTTSVPFQLQVFGIDNMCVDFTLKGCSQVLGVGLRFARAQAAFAETEVSTGNAPVCVSAVDLGDSPIDYACGAQWSLCLRMDRMVVGQNYFAGCPTIEIAQCKPPWSSGAPMIVPLPLDCFESGFECRRQTNCDECIANGCGWCADDEKDGAEGKGSCQDGNIWGPLCEDCGSLNCSCSWNYGKCPLKKVDMAKMAQEIKDQSFALANVSSQLTRTFDRISTGDSLLVAGDEYKCMTHAAQGRTKGGRTLVTIVVSVCLFIVFLITGCYAGKTGLADEAVLVVSGLCSSIPWPASLGGQRSAQADESIYAQT